MLCLRTTSSECCHAAVIGICMMCFITLMGSFYVNLWLTTATVRDPRAAVSFAKSLPMLSDVGLQHDVSVVLACDACICMLMEKRTHACL